ncbi:hypothetical protein R3P38DRAFT_3186511 [Favolaschia claudopus]|uniref:Methyltransferase ausD n=1 Tax=Favolaschia claudopus TaxID=2862362 RepID=A0AAW0C2Q8_9AGAR
MTEPPQDNHTYANEQEFDFLKTQTGIQDDQALTAHVAAVQKKALEVYNYPCIERYGFIKLKIDKFPPAYEHVLRLGSTIPGAMLLDVGCCFGNDLRKIASDGFPVRNLIGSDLRQGFWDLGHELFRTTPETFPAAFAAGDVLDPAFLSLSSDPVPPVDLGSLTSLNALRGQLSAIHSASVFHLFDEGVQLELARKLAGLLVRRPGSIIFGCHGAHPTKGPVLGVNGRQMFCHSPESWRNMWDGEVFPRGSVEVSSHIVNAGKILNDTTDFYMLFWAVKLL